MKYPAAYVRRSTTSENNPGEISHADQLTAVHALAQARGFNGDLMVFDDWGKSADLAKEAKRLEFNRMLAAVERGEVSHIFAAKLDRLYRSQATFLRLMDAANRNGVVVETSQDGVLGGDGSPMAKAFSAITAVFTELELNTIKARVKSSIAARRARGDEFGSFRYGYRTARQPDGAIRWERDPAVPLNQVLEVVRANRGNIQASCVKLDELGILAPRGGSRWGTSALTRIVDREDPGVRPHRDAAGKRQPTRSVLTGLVPCPHCGMAMTPVGTRDALYCHLGRRTAGHGKYFAKDAPILALLHSLTDGRTFTRMTWARTSPDAAVLAKADERWRRVNRRYQAGGIQDDEYGAETTRWKAAVAGATQDDEWAIDRQPGNPFVRWGAEPRLVNEDLRRLFLGVRLDPVTLAPVNATWRNRNLARHPALQVAG